MLGSAGDLELDWSPCLLLNDRGTVSNPAAGAHIIDLQPYKVAASQLAIDREIKEGKVALSMFELKPDPNCPNVLRFQRALLPGKPSLIPRHIPRLRWWLPFAIHDRLRWSRPPPPQRLPISGRENSIRTTGLSIAADVRPRHPHPHYSTQAVRKRLVPRCRAAGERQCSDGMATAQFNPGISSRPTRNSIVEFSKSSHARAITDPWAGLFCKI